MTESVTHKLLDGRRAAAEIQEGVVRDAAGLAEMGWAPRLVSVTVGDEEAVDVYVRNQRRRAEACGIAFEERNFAADVSRAEIVAALRAMNSDPRITGVIIQRPVPEHLSIRDLQMSIHPLKDVEGMRPASIGNIVYNDLDLAPCTALASVELLKRTPLGLKGLEVVVIGHSEIVGKPIAFMLMAEGGNGDGVPPHDPQPGHPFAPGRRGVRRCGQARAGDRRDDQAGRGADRHRHQPDRRWPHRGGCGFRQLRRGGGVDHAGARRRRAGDGGDPDA